MVLLILVIIFSTNFTADFVKQIERSSSKELITGNIYYISSQCFAYHVESPVNQILTYTNDTTLIYYPIEKTAFKIVDIRLQNLMSDTRMLDIGEIPNPSNIGYTLIKRIKSGDTLYYYWIPADKKKRETVIIGKLVNRIISVEIITDKITQLIRYVKYIEKDAFMLPTEIYFKRITSVDTLIEITNYSNIEFNVNIPDSIINIHLPEDTDIKEIRW